MPNFRDAFWAAPQHAHNTRLKRSRASSTLSVTSWWSGTACGTRRRMASTDAMLSAHFEHCRCIAKIIHGFCKQASGHVHEFSILDAFLQNLNHLFLCVYSGLLGSIEVLARRCHYQLVCSDDLPFCNTTLQCPNLYHNLVQRSRMRCVEAIIGCDGPSHRPPPELNSSIQ